MSQEEWKRRVGVHMRLEQIIQRENGMDICMQPEEAFRAASFYTRPHEYQKRHYSQKREGLKDSWSEPILPDTEESHLPGTGW
jgi:hypothetical protein